MPDPPHAGLESDVCLSLLTVVHIASQATLLENSRLEAAISTLKDEQEHTKRELEQRRAAGVNLQAAIQQMQTAVQAVANASLQLNR